MVEHAIACGEALLEAKAIIPGGQWQAWMEENLPHGVRRSMCRNYMRLAFLKEHVDPELPIRTNLQLVTGLEKRASGTPRVPEETKREALRLHATGTFTNAEIARTVGVTKDTIRAWTDPDWAKRKQDQSNQRRQQRTVALRAEQPPTPEEDPAYTYGEPGRAEKARKQA
jgi:transposase-like protein